MRILSGVLTRSSRNCMGLFKKRAKPAALPFVSAVVPAAGVSARMNGVSKILADAAGEPVIVHTLTALNNCAYITEIIVAAREEDIRPVAAFCRDLGLDKVKKVLKGGQSRIESVMLALMEISPKAKLTAVHDGARPFVTDEVITGAVLKALQTGAAAPAIPVTDTIKETEDGITVLRTPDRSRYVHIQTPQCFEPSLLKAALTLAVREKWEITDDCSAVERFGVTVHLTQGCEKNIKITTQADLTRMRAILYDENWTGI